MNLSNQLLLTLLYLRHYDTYLTLAQRLGISESYANKLFHKTIKILIQILHIPPAIELNNSELLTVLIDASEQKIERPIRQQKRL